MSFFILTPEVAGNIFGINSVVDVSVHPPKVDELDYEFEGWLGDDLLESFPCFIATENLTNALTEVTPSGVEFDSMMVSKSESFDEINPNTELPKFVWLKINGKAGINDFGLTEDYVLVVSEKILDILKSFQIDNCEVEIF